MKNNDTNTSYYQTSDLPLTVTLVSLGFSIFHLDISNSSRVIFFFPNSEKLAEAVADYWNGQLTVEPQTFWTNQRLIKARIQNEVQTRSFRG